MNPRHARRLDKQVMYGLFFKHHQRRIHILTAVFRPEFASTFQKEKTTKGESFQQKTKQKQNLPMKDEAAKQQQQDNLEIKHTTTTSTTTNYKHKTKKKKQQLCFPCWVKKKLKKRKNGI